MPSARSQDLARLDDLLADDVVFRGSRRVRAWQQGKALEVSAYLIAMAVLGPSLQYVSEWMTRPAPALEFEAELEGSYVQGVDILRWDGEGKLVSFTVMARPMRGLEKLIELMGRQLTAG